jgi:hypothetical protein
MVDIFNLAIQLAQKIAQTRVNENLRRLGDDHRWFTRLWKLLYSLGHKRE